MAAQGRVDKLSRDDLWVKVVKEIGRVAQGIRDRIQAEALVQRKESGLRDYREAAEKYYSDGVISEGEQTNLDWIAQKFGLPLRDVEQIMGEVKAQYEGVQAGLEQYRQIVLAEIRHYGGLPEKARSTLADARRLREIPELQTDAIDQEVLTEWQRQRQQAEAEVARQAELRQQQEADERVSLKSFSFDVVKLDRMARKRVEKRKRLNILRKL